MNWVTSIFQNLALKTSPKFLAVFSFCIIAITGVVWACADAGEEDYSAFSPEYFVAKEYTPFFYDSEYTYYHGDLITYKEEDSNTRYNTQIVDEWYQYLHGHLDKKQLGMLLFETSRAGVDSIYNDIKNGNHPVIINHSEYLSHLSRQETKIFFDYLLLAKSSESFTVNYPLSWEKTKHLPVADTLENEIFVALQKSNDKFIQERLWFQLVRYHFYKDTIVKEKLPLKSRNIVKLFNAYKNSFPKNLTYYRTLGYLAGHYYRNKDYSEANYLYSLCYDYCYQMKIPSNWSFHPQNEDDWAKTLALAKTNDEKVTLWHLLGIGYDPVRGIKEIASLNPKSDKLDLLLSRLVNIRETTLPVRQDSVMAEAKRELHFVDSIALLNNTAKPYFWNLTAGYLNYLNGNFNTAGKFYYVADSQMPANNKLLIAQYKLLNVLLYVGQLKHISASNERWLVEPLNWLAALRDGRDSVKYLRYNWALSRCTKQIANLYSKQNDPVKALMFKDTANFYLNNNHVEALKSLFKKPNKTAFEKTMIAYYPLKIEDLYYYQATLAVYHQDLNRAVTLMKMAGRNNSTSLGVNPFKSRLIDCHDCDFEAHQQPNYSPMKLVLRMKFLKDQLQAGHNKYRNALLLANAYYNITHFGNARLFYQSAVKGTGATEPTEIYKPFRKYFASSALAENYYLIARSAANTTEQKAKCTFMAAKCEHNNYDMRALEIAEANDKLYGAEVLPPPGKFFAELKDNYSTTKYYKEVLKECGYFKSYLQSNK